MFAKQLGIRYVARSRSFYMSSATLFPKGIRTTEVFSEMDREQREVETIQEVESNLFEPASRPVTHRIENIIGNKKVKNLKPKEDWVQPPNLYEKRFAKSKPSTTTVNDTSLGLEYIKLELNDPVLNNLFTTIRSRKRRYKNKQIVVEGRRLIEEALSSQNTLQVLLFSQKDQLDLIKDKIQELKNVKIYKIPHHDLKTWSTLTTPPGIIAIFSRPSDRFATNLQNKTNVPITVICDNIREPNNLGSIIRTCAAIPCSQVIVLKGSCDPWDSKALRGGCGGQFRVDIKDDVHWDDLSSFLPKDFSLFVAENNLPKIEKQLVDGSSINFQLYSDACISAEHNVVIIGGENHGISQDAYRFLTSSKSGACLHIPLANGVESLNTAAALTLILFEIRRKYLQLTKQDDCSEMAN